MKVKLSDIFIGDFKITQYFGANPSMYAKFGLKGHNGVDWATPLGTQIIAAHDGEVVRVENNPSGYGINVRLWNREQGIATIYAHFQKATVIVGEKVVAGQLIGHANSTGYSTGHHLHFAYCKTDEKGVRLNQDNGYGGWLNPLDGRSVEWDIKNPTEPVKPQTGHGVYTEEEMTKIRLERDKNWGLYQNEKEAKEGLEKQVEHYQHSIEEIASQLNCGGDVGEIKRVIEELLAKAGRVEDVEKQKLELQDLAEQQKSKIVKLEEDLEKITNQYVRCGQALKEAEKASGKLKSEIKNLEEEFDKRETELGTTILKHIKEIDELKKKQDIADFTSFELLQEIWRRLFKQ